MTKDFLLTKYQTMASLRAHFAQLFFLVTGFALAFSLALFVVLKVVMATSWSIAAGVSGLIIGAGALIEYRLLLRERACFEEMRAIERNVIGTEEMVQMDERKLGAMEMVLLAQLGVAAVLCLTPLVAKG